MYESRSKKKKMAYCYVCGAPDPQVRCPRCKHAEYCGERCARDDWTRGIHEAECYDCNGGEALLGELAADLEQPLPSSVISARERRLAQDILRREHTAQALSWLRANRMNAHVVSHELNEVEHTPHLESFLNLSPEHDLSWDALVGQAIAVDFIGRSSTWEKVKDWGKRRYAAFKKWRAKRKAKKQGTEEPQEEYQGGDDEYGAMMDRERRERKRRYRPYYYD